MIKGEIDFLSKILNDKWNKYKLCPYKNFKNISEIAAAKGDINNINKHGSIIFNADDKFLIFKN